MRAGGGLARFAATTLVAMIVLVLGCTGTAIAAEPVLSILHPVEGSSTGEQQPIFQGTSTDPSDSVTLEIHEGGPEGTLIQTATVPTPVELGPEQATWEVAPGSPLAPGEYTAVAEQTNIFSEPGSTSVTFTIDTAPVVSIKPVSSPTKDPTPTLSGGASDGVGDDETVSVAIYEGGSVGGTVASAGVVARSGTSWEYTPATSLPEGSYTAQATQGDEAGAVDESGAVTFVVDTTPPAVSISTVASPTKNTRPTFTGGAGVAVGDDKAVEVAIYEGASASGTPAVSGSASVSGSSWSYTPGTALHEGTYTAQAVQEDDAGNVGKSSGVTFTVLTKLPVVSMNAVSSPTNDPTPTLSGAASDGAGDDATVSVTIYEGGSVGGTVATAGVVARSGANWEYTPASPLPEGTYTAQATQADEAGNVGKSSGVTFVVDTTPPAVSISAVVSPTKNTRPTFTGGAGVAAGDDKAVEVAIYEGASASGTPAVSGPATVTGSSWSYTPATALPEGTYTAQATQADDAGNVGTSLAVTFTVLTKLPVVSMNSVPSPTDDPTPTLSGAASDGVGDDGTVSVTIYEGGSVGGTVAAAGVVARSGANWEYTSATRLPEGTYTAQATQEDEAGNVGKSVGVTFVVDTTPPALTLKTPAPGPPLHVSQPTFSGLAGDAPGDVQTVTLTVYDDAEGDEVAAGPIELIPNHEKDNEWTTGSTGPRLPNGIYTAVATQRDEAGNEAKKTTTFTIDTNSPDVTLGTSGFVTRGSQLVTGPTPSFSGTGATEPEDSSAVVVKIYSGSSASGTPLRPPVPALLSSSEWTTGPVEALPDGTYTVQAEQEDSNSQTGVSKAVTFTVDANAPLVTLSSPSNGSSTTSSSQTVSGSAGTEEGDLPDVSVQLYAGSSNGGQALESITVGASAGGWSTVLGGLSPGIYTAQAEQSDDVGNVGHSEPVTFTVLAPTVATNPSPPAASFTWFPAAPHTGEAISLVSTSTDASTAIASFGWALTGNDVFSTGGSTISTSFSTAGPHVVQLRVVDANGQSSVVSETIPVSTPVIPLMQPFPVVRIAGSFNSAGAKIGVLTVLAPVGATVRVTCRGGGCPAKPQSLRATAPAKSKASTVLVRFRRFERSLRPGVVLDVWVSDAGELGKFTRFVIRRDKAPTRTDLCLNPAGTIPLVCPAS
jgi:hypothetical protein